MFINNDFGYLFVNYRPNFHSQTLAKVSDKLFNEYIQKIGLSKQYLNYIKKIKHNQKIKLEYINGNSQKGTFAEISDVELRQFFGHEQKDNIRIVSAQLSKVQGYRIDPAKTSVLEFYSTLKAIELDAKNKA